MSQYGDTHPPVSPANLHPQILADPLKGMLFYTTIASVLESVHTNFSELLESRINNYFPDFYKHTSDENSRNIHHANDFMKRGLRDFFMDLAASVIPEISTADYLWQSNQNVSNLKGTILDSFIRKLKSAKTREMKMLAENQMLQNQIQNIHSGLSGLISEPETDFNVDLDADEFKVIKATLLSLKEKLDLIYRLQGELKNLREELWAKEEGLKTLSLNESERQEYDAQRVAQILQITKELQKAQEDLIAEKKRNEIEHTNLQDRLDKAEKHAESLERDLESEKATFASRENEYEASKINVEKCMGELSALKKERKDIITQSERSIKSRIMELRRVVDLLGEETSIEKPDAHSALRASIEEYANTLEKTIELELKLRDVVQNPNTGENTLLRPIILKALTDLLTDLREKSEIIQDATGDLSSIEGGNYLADRHPLIRSEVLHSSAPGVKISAAGPPAESSRKSKKMGRGNSPLDENKPGSGHASKKRMKPGEISLKTEHEKSDDSMNVDENRDSNRQTKRKASSSSKSETSESTEPSPKLSSALIRRSRSKSVSKKLAVGDLIPNNLGSSDGKGDSSSDDPVKYYPLSDADSDL